MQKEKLMYVLNQYPINPIHPNQRFQVFEKFVIIIRIDRKSMLKYYLSKDYRRTYDELEKLGLLSESLAIKYSSYENYTRELLLANSTITQHLEILASDKLAPIKIMKSLIFIHAWLQTASSFQQVQPFYAYMEHVLKVSAEMALKFKNARKSFERKRAKSAIFKNDFVSGQEIEMNKQVFLLEKVVKPYVLYLQKLVSVFPFYCSVKKTLYRTLATAQIWIILNLFKYGYGVTMHIPTICKFIRKSFNPVAQSLAQAFSSDFSSFYPKLSNYIHEQSNRIQARFDDLQRKFGQRQAYKADIEGLDDAVNLLQDIAQLNNQLEAIYSETSLRARVNIHRPKFVNLNEQIFQFVLHINRRKITNDFGDQTPKFYRTHSSRPSQQTQGDKLEGRPELTPIFRDISNDQDNVCTFRKDRQSDRQIHIVPRYKKKNEPYQNDC